MTDQMQKFGHRDSPYARPTQKWRCGRGEACKAGPGSDGTCPFQDSPCSPIRSVKSHKRRIFALTLGIAFFSLVILFAGKTTIEYLSPGPLSVTHAQVTTCKDCHSAVSESVSDWISKAVHLNSNNDDKKCLDCHKLGENAFLPHSTAREILSAAQREAAPAGAQTSSNWGVTLAGQLRALQSDDADEISCAVCHREHQGRFASADEFDSQQCHVCHAVKFTKLETEHPPYTDFPYERETRINFDHVAHLGKHFLDEDYVNYAPEGCKQCHDTDQSGEWMLAKSFEASCTNCHLGEILGDARANSKGVAVLSIPEIDLQSLKDAGYYIGQWPEWADGRLTPVMRLLLPEKLQQAARHYSTPMGMIDLSTANAQELRSAAELAWGVKELLYDIQMGGTALMNRRIAEGLDESLDQSTLNLLVASLPKDTLVNNQKEWFPMLMEEVSQFRAGEISVAAGAGAGPDAATAPGIPVQRDDTIFPGDDALTDNGDNDALISSELIDLAEANLLLEDDDVITLDPDDIALDDDDAITFDPNDILLDDDEDDGGAQEQVAAASLRQSMEAVYDNEEWARTGGWYRDGSTIFYRPIGHADPFLKTWLDVTSGKDDPIGRRLFASLNDDEAVGKCVKCHSVETLPSGAQAGGEGEGAASGAVKKRINWRGFSPDHVGVEFNRFSHAAHFGLMNDEGCSSCHKLNEASEDDEAPGAHSFAFIENETCTTCHQKGQAPDNCLTCHNYHVEPYARSIELIADYLRKTPEAAK